MNIEISAQECRDLLDIVHIADVVMSGHRREEDKRTQRHRSLIQKLYGTARNCGLDSLVRYDEAGRTYVPTPEFEEQSLAHGLIEEFGDHLFWDQLIARLSARDAAELAGGFDRLNALSGSARQAMEGPLRQRYIDEFASNGVANLRMVEGLRPGGGIPVRTSD
jgi:hypothetical protein